MKYRIELIPKTSTLTDIIGPWVCSGRVDNRADGAFIFDNVEACYVADGTVHIFAEDKSYFYNLADFYRVKAVKVEAPETADWVGGVK
jgi:hypothetical protein